MAVRNGRKLAEREVRGLSTVADWKVGRWGVGLCVQGGSGGGAAPAGAARNA